MRKGKKSDIVRDSPMEAGNLSTIDSRQVTLADVISTSENDELRRLLAANHSCPAQILTYLSNDVNAKVRLGVACNPMTPVHTLVMMILNKEWRDPEVVELGSAQSIEEKVEFFRQDDEYDVQVAVAQNTALPPDIIRALAYSANNDTRRVIASNDSLPIEELERLSFDEHFSVRKACAASTRLSIARLGELASDGDEGVRRNVAGNPRTSARILRRLAKDESRWVHLALRNNPTLTPSLRQLLHAPVVHEVELDATVHPILSPKAIELPQDRGELMDYLSDSKKSHDLEWLYLASDVTAPFDLVIGSLANVAGLPKLSNPVDPLMYAAVSFNTPLDQCQAILKSKNVEVRVALVRRVSKVCQDRAVIEKITLDPSPLVRKTFANLCESNASENDWNILANDSDDEVRTAVLENMFAPAPYRAIAKLRLKTVKRRAT